MMFCVTFEWTMVGDAVSEDFGEEKVGSLPLVVQPVFDLGPGDSPAEFAAGDGGCAFWSVQDGVEVYHPRVVGDGSPAIVEQEIERAEVKVRSFR